MHLPGFEFSSLEIGSFETSETIRPMTHRYIQEGRSHLIILSWVIFFSQWHKIPKWGLGRAIFEVSSSRTFRNALFVGLPWTSDQLVAEAATFTTHNKR